MFDLSYKNIILSSSETHYQLILWINLKVLNNA